MANVISALEAHGCGVRGNDERGYDAQCPAHDDRNPSLHVEQGHTNRAVFTCHAGCEREAVLDALGLTWADLRDDEDDGGSFPRGNRGPRPPHQPPKVSVNPTHSSTESKSSSRGKVPVDTRPAPAEDAPLYALLREWRRGDLKPDFEVRLDLARLPANAFALRSLAEAIGIAMGFHLTLGETRPLPLSGSFVAWLMGQDVRGGARQGRRMLDALVRHGVLEDVGELHPRGWPRGTRLFEPTTATLGAIFHGATSTDICDRCGKALPTASEQSFPCRNCDACADMWNMAQECPDGHPHDLVATRDVESGFPEIFDCRRCGLMSLARADKGRWYVASR